jgi:hypothetical protein
MHLNVLKFVKCQNFFLQSCLSIEVYVSYIYHVYFLLIIYLFPLSPKLLKLLKSCCLVCICLKVQLPGVFWASVKSHDTDKYLFYDFVLTFSVYLLDCVCSGSYLLHVISVWLLFTWSFLCDVSANFRSCFLCVLCVRQVNCSENFFVRRIG